MRKPQYLRLGFGRKGSGLAAPRWPLAGRTARLWRWLARRRGGGGSPGADRLARRRAQRVEAVLFLAGEPLSSRKISEYANLADGTQARTLIRRLNDQYDRGGRAFRVEELAGGFQLLTRPRLACWLRRFADGPSGVQLSAPALETLAVAAYRQPVLRAQIEAIRGVACGEMLRQLLERELVRIEGRSEELGRPYLYSTTKRFLQLFGLRSLDELPRADVLRDEAPPHPRLQEEDRTPSGESSSGMTIAKPVRSLT